MGGTAVAVDYSSWHRTLELEHHEDSNLVRVSPQPKLTLHIVYCFLVNHEPLGWLIAAHA